MDTLEFLKAVWPEHGNYCIALPFKTDDMIKESYTHHPFKTIEEAVSFAKSKSNKNVFFAVHTLKQPHIEDTNGKLNYNRTGPKLYFRTHENMLESRAFFFDLDVGESKPGAPPKYATREDALGGLESFLFLTGLPSPLVTSSGGGFHVYWLLTQPLDSLIWRRYAGILHHIAKRVGLLADPARTTDQASVLRVVGTTNIKPGRAPRPCVAMEAGETTQTQAFIEELEAILGDEVVPDVGTGLRTRAAGRGNLGRVYDGEIPTLDEVIEVCDHVADYYEVGGHTEGNEPIWYNVGCGVIPYCQDGYNEAQRLSANHPRYDYDVTDAKIEQWKDASDDAPASCAKLNQICGGDACARCPFAGLGKGPAAIAIKRRTLQRKAEAVHVTEADIVPACPPGAPYKRGEHGITKSTLEKKDGQESWVDHPVFPPGYDIFPHIDHECTAGELAFMQWAIKVPQTPQKLVKISHSDLNDTRALGKILSNQRVLLNDPQVGKAREMMIHYARTLQANKPASRQFDHLGWVDGAKAEFILPTQLYNVDGTTAPCKLSAMAQSGVSYIKQAGSLKESIKAMEFYNEPKYLKHQFMVLCGLGSILYHATGLDGIVVNATGPTGGSKSTALYAAASLWGYPKSYVMNATNQGMTSFARLERVHTLCQLPACMDEITHMDPKHAKDFAIAVSQPDPRTRLKQDGTERPARGGRKALMVLTSSNSSLNDLVGIENRAGTAGNMRIFEIMFETLKLPPQAADAFLRTINENYGWIGPEFLSHYIKRREEVDDMTREIRDDLNREHNLIGTERFWGAGGSCPLVAGRVAKKLGLLPFDIDPIRDWVYGPQLKQMRSVVKDENDDSKPTTVLSNFIHDRFNSIIRVSGRENAPQNFHDQAVRDPHATIDGMHDEAKNVIYIRKDAFRSWCTTRHKDWRIILRELEEGGQIRDVGKLNALGRDTKFGSARSVCFTVDLTRMP